MKMEKQCNTQKFNDQKYEQYKTTRHLLKRIFRIEFETPLFYTVTLGIISTFREFTMKAERQYNCSFL